MLLNIGQQVSYPSQGVCLIEGIKRQIVGQTAMDFYALRVLNDNSTILVPKANAEAVGIRPVISLAETKKLLRSLELDFENISGDWKIRSRECAEKLQSGDVFAAADVLKKLTFLSREKKLSFREQNLLEKAKFLLVSEIANVSATEAEKIETKIIKLVESACDKHFHAQPEIVLATIH